MTADFAAAATRLAAVSARLLGWRPQDFWQATPAELAQSLGPVSAAEAPPSRDDIQRMMERDDNGR